MLKAAYPPGVAVSQHFPQVLSVAEGATHVVQSDASAQVSPPPVVVVPVVLDPVVVVAVVFDPVVVIVPVVFDPVVVIMPVVLPPEPVPPAPPVSPEVVPVPLDPHPVATANIETTIAPNAQDFMLMPPTTRDVRSWSPPV